MKNILVTGGTVFVSRYVAEYFKRSGDRVFVLNRNTRPQPEGVTLIEGDRHQLSDKLKGYHFDAVLDITAYTGKDVEDLLDALDSFEDYVLISSSAVYPETLPQPFTEGQPCGPNALWGAYGTNKLEAEQALQARFPRAYILRPPYLYGPMENIYREPFVFDCADAGRPFYIPGDGNIGLQFFHVEDLCRFIGILLEKKPSDRIFNVGNPQSVDINTWVRLCYEAAGKPLTAIHVGSDHPQWAYFPFRSYDYRLDVSRQLQWMPETKPLLLGLQEACQWHRAHPEDVNRRPYQDYIDQHLA